MKKCINKSCKKEFVQKTSLQVYCYECVLAKAKELTDKKYRKQEKVAKKALKISLKTISDYKEDLQKEINKMIRLIDYSQVCISCGNVPKKINACHFHSVGSNPALRFNLLNIYLGCEHCNSYKGGNVHGYDNGLIENFGREFWEILKFEMPQKYSILQLKKDEIIEATKIAKEINKNICNDTNVLSNEQRLEVRQLFNEKIGIYK